MGWNFQLSAEILGRDIVTTHIGVVPEDETVDRYKIMQEACFELSRYADSIGSHFAMKDKRATATIKICGSPNDFLKLS